MKPTQSDMRLMNGLDRALAFERAVEEAKRRSPELASAGITCEKYMFDDGTSEHVYAHPALGEVGSVRIEERDGRTCISGRVAGSTDDPLHEQRKAVFEPLMEVSATASGARCVEGNHQTCEHCGAIAASLIFLDGGEPSDFEACARDMYDDYSRRSVPVWIIGPQVGDGPEPERAADILKVWPVREPLRRMRPDEFNPFLERIVAAHCRETR